MDKAKAGTSNQQVQRALIPLSQLYTAQKGNITPDQHLEYSLAAKSIDLKRADDVTITFLTDYFNTMAMIHQTTAKRGQGFTNIEDELTRLPDNGSSTIKLNELVIKPEVFDGVKPKPRKWIQEYNEAILANGWGDKIAIKYLPVYLTGPAKDWYFIEIRPRLTDAVKWSDVYQQFMKNYLTQSDYESLSAAVVNAKQRADESVSNFIPRLRRLMLLLSPTLPEDEQLRQLRNKLRPEYKQLLALTDPKNIADLKKNCLMIEAGFSTKQKASTSRTDDQLRRRGPNNRPSSRTVSGTRRPRQNTRTEPRKSSTSEATFTCNNCGKPGHYAKDCWSKKKPPQTGGSKTGPKRQVNLVDRLEDEEVPTEVLTVSTTTEKNPGRKPRYVVESFQGNEVNLLVGGGKLLKQKLICNDVEIAAIVDTGAYVTVIDEALVKHFDWSAQTKGVALVGADGNKLPCSGSVRLQLELTIRNVTKRKIHDVCVVRNLTAPMLLGLELMREFGLIIDTVSNELKFAKNQLKNGVRVIGPKMLPARSQSIVEAKVNTIGLVLTRPFMLESGALVANSMSEVANNRMNTVVVNPFDKALWLEDETKIASVETLNSDEVVELEVKRALGMFSYYRKFVTNFAIHAEPLTKLTKKKVQFVWGDEQKKAYQHIISALKENATLTHFSHKLPILVKTDASKKGVAGMLLQLHENDWKLITCCSRRLSASEENYGIMDLEGLALVYTITKLRSYLLGKPFKILVDHCALCVLTKRAPNSARLRRWAIVLSEYHFGVVYTKGKLHCDVDCLSRNPVDDPVDLFLEISVYFIRLANEDEWFNSYSDKESKDYYQKAYDKEEGLILRDNIIYKGNLLYVPHSQRRYITQLVHGSTNAHPGIAGTISKLKEHYWWNNMREDVEYIVKTCTTCLLQKPDRQKKQGSMEHFQIFEPGEQVAIDLIEKITESHNGNQYIIVAVDMFTRLVDAKAVPDKGAPEFTQYLIEYCGRFGVPHSILTDNSTTFCNELTNQIVKVFGAGHFRTTPYHSQGNAVVERTNQKIEEKLRCILDDPLQERNWDQVLPIAVLAINTTYHNSIGCTPYEMTFGRRPPLQDKNLTFKASPYDQFAKMVQSYMKECHSCAFAIQSAAQEKSRNYYEEKRRTTLFDIGDKVAVRAPSRSSKLSAKFSGPFEIVDRKKDIYTLLDPKSNRTFARHVADLKSSNLPSQTIASEENETF